MPASPLALGWGLASTNSVATGSRPSYSTWIWIDKTSDAQTTATGSLGMGCWVETTTRGGPKTGASVAKGEVVFVWVEALATTTTPEGDSRVTASPKRARPWHAVGSAQGSSTPASGSPPIGGGASGISASEFESDPVVPEAGEATGGVEGRAGSVFVAQPAKSARARRVCRAIRQTVLAAAFLEKADPKSLHTKPLLLDLGRERGLPAKQLLPFRRFSMVTGILSG